MIWKCHPPTNVDFSLQWSEISQWSQWHNYHSTNQQECSDIAITVLVWTGFVRMSLNGIKRWLAVLSDPREWTHDLWFCSDFNGKYAFFCIQVGRTNEFQWSDIPDREGKIQLIWLIVLTISSSFYYIHLLIWIVLIQIVWLNNIEKSGTFYVDKFKSIYLEIYIDCITHDALWTFD